MEPAPQHFVPMLETQQWRPSRRGDNGAAEASPHHVAELVRNGFSARYRGNPWVASNRSRDNIPDEDNCSFFIRGLPPQSTVGSLLSQIRGIGRVYQTVLVPPQHGFPTGAAKLTFFTKEAATAFFESYGGPRPANRLLVEGRGVVVTRNRIKVSQQLGLPEDCSRVLFIAGDSALVNPRFLEEFFAARLRFEMEDIVVLYHDETMDFTVLECRFGSFRCQAQAAKLAIELDLVGWGFEIEVRFGKDPCDKERTL